MTTLRPSPTRPPSSSAPPEPAGRLAGRGLGPGQTTRLNRILYQHGQRNGRALFLPYDQGFEHG
ncbi:hypothetical protein Athai_09150 [Actinocatenispora thailandica]|uniref:Uncharacterized protein n=1 Tax=Actinocatenispora thailandica TaxID=227318 RepID=A0A7R7HUT8_9ACTN|nr:hypothetical protein Athai_09150 [Actinocatenispora thailandica]